MTYTFMLSCMRGGKWMRNSVASAIVIVKALGKVFMEMSLERKVFVATYVRC